MCRLAVFGARDAVVGSVIEVALRCASSHSGAAFTDISVAWLAGVCLRGQGGSREAEK